MGKKPKQKIILPPELPPEIPDDEVEISDDDLQFVKDNRAFASLLSTLDTQSITRHVTRVADAKDDALEKLYEQRMQKTALKKEKEETGLQVDRVDALPIKTLDGKLYYRTATNRVSENGPNEEEAGEDENVDKGLVKLTKAEKRAKLKKMRKEEKKHGKEVPKAEVEETPQAAVLAEVKEDLEAEETFETKKCKLAELGNALLTDPESNIKFLKEMVQISKDNDHTIVKLGLLSLLAVFKDIVPGYRIRLPTEKEQEMKVSKTVRKMRYYESTLLSSYKVYLQRLIALEKKPLFQLVAIRCMCSLLDANPHFNFREGLLEATVRNISSSDEAIRKLCCSTIKSLFTNEGKHGGEATVEAVRLISEHVKAHNCQMHPDSVEVFLSLSFDEDLGKSEKKDEDQKFKKKKGWKRKNMEPSNQLPENDRKRSRKDSISKTKEEIEAEYKAASLTTDVMERRQMQTETLSAVFETYFRILKHTMHSVVARPEENPDALSAGVEPHPLLAPCLKGLAKFSHLLDLDFMGDLMNHLKVLASGSSNSGNTSEKCPKCLSVSERLQCCIVAFKVMRINLEALNVDLQDFLVHLYNLIVEYRPGRDQGEVLAEALKIMLCDDRQQDMQKAAAFIKRLATLSLCVGSADSMAALVTVKHLLQKNVKCRNLLENDIGGGSVSGTISKYQPYSTDPNLSGALASVLWELSLLSKHYHPSISTMASGISSMSSAQNQVLYTRSSPQQALTEMSLDQELCFTQISSIKLNNKKRRTNGPAASTSTGSTTATTPLNDDELRKKLSSHFMVLHDIKENEKLRSKLDRTTRSLQLYEQYKKQKKQRSKPTRLSAIA
ncbi:nucleolar complex-associated protein 3 [Lotus japonicus]|uniref:nucleolar complex-associated protein 3 n=1 Tax=Lotus japonicus TaxID=34305 RepID=UPI002589BCFE|nr:nucleolar complex-associated protein 3 [Lotus japonicus]